MKILIPEDMDIIEPPDKNSIWCQARGTAMEVSGAESKADSSEKVLLRLSYVYCFSTFALNFI